MAILSKSRQLKKEMSLFNIFTFATGATIASGFFLLPGLAYSQAGTAMIISYIIAAVLVIPALFSMAELSTAMPRAGGIYFFLDRSMGPLMGTIGGIGTWFALILKTAFALVGIGAYTSLFFPDAHMTFIAIGFALCFGIINLLGTRKSGIFQSALVITLLILVLWFLGSGVSKINITHFERFFDADFKSIFSTSGLVFVSYVGLSKVASISEEVKNPEHNLPLGMFLALGTALVLYVFGTIVMIGVVPGEVLSLDLTPVASAAHITSGTTGILVMTIAAIFAFFSVANAGILSCSRYPLAMSRDHLMPRFLRHLTRHQIPKNSIVLTLFFIILTLIFFNPIKIAKLAGAFQLLLFSLISLSVIVMRESRIDSYDPGFRSPLYPWMQIFGILSPLWLILEMGFLPILFSILLIVIGILWYYYFARDRVSRNGAVYHILARLGQHRFEGLDSELRSILKEKGLRDQDPFDAVVANAQLIDIDESLTFEKVVEEAAIELSRRINVEPEILKKTFMEGTQVGATPVSGGAALPHLRLADIRHSELVIVRSKPGVAIDIESEFIRREVSGEPVHAFFFLASPKENPGQHLRILAQIASHVDDETFMERWLSGKNEQELKELLLREDRFLSITLHKDDLTRTLIDREIQQLNLPEGSLIAMIHRNGEIIFPGGNTLLHENDRLTVIGYPSGIQELYNLYVK